MAKSRRLEPPQPSTGDTAHLVASGILSFIPGAPELFRRFVTPPIERRQYEWMQEVAAAIKRLEKWRGITVEELSRDEVFVSVVLQATSVALRNHHEEKIRALANGILHAGSGTHLAIDLQLAFVRFVDELSPSHMVLLQAVQERQKEIAPLTSYENLYQLLSPGIPGIMTRDIFRMICLDLQVRGLIRISPDIEEFEGIYEASALLAEQTKDDLPRVIISEVGQQFLAFVSDVSDAA